MAEKWEFVLTPQDKRRWAELIEESKGHAADCQLLIEEGADPKGPEYQRAIALMFEADERLERFQRETGLS